MPNIKPTVGRVVWYHRGRNPLNPADPDFETGALAAVIAYVHNDSYVNLMVSDEEGKSFGAQNVYLAGPDDEVPFDLPYCEWMPYQVGQAAKTEELEKKLASK